MSPGRKYIVVLGTIMSGLGKGIVTASIARLLKTHGYKVAPLKFDGYLNIDCGTMNPFRHGEVFVLDDGGEVDMDFGTYERFLNTSLTKLSSITGGKIFQLLLEKERKGDYLGRDVQMVPHLTGEIIDRVKSLGGETKADIVLIEVGGTVGDIENGYFIEAMRQMSRKEDVLFIQLTYVPSLSPGEQKTKPTQHSNRLIQSLGIKPEIILCREQEPLSKEAREKIALFCDVPQENVFDDPIVETVYKLPQVLEKQKLYDAIAKRFHLRKTKVNIGIWNRMVRRITSPSKKKVQVGIIGKYTAVKDAYVSVKEAILHAAAANNVCADVCFVESTDIEKKGTKLLNSLDAIIVPGGFGKRGIEGKIAAARYARKNKVPFLGLCLGMQMMVIEYARDVCGLEGANSEEIDKSTPYPVIALLPEQMRIEEKGGTMRLGSYPCVLGPESKSFSLYKKKLIHERHRHRYEVNPAFVEQLEQAGLVISGKSPKKGIVEMAEWKESFGIGTQAHPELKSRLEDPAPLFVGLIKAAIENNKTKKKRRKSKA
ncbi:CTP synthase (glutamine hydrolyzing) [Candidatus Micrarchaeota archaeon]|nr:CTP synthase (glutamine hydrolyzing) [Candidatus Micrarchaeota archaeon]MBD3417779.1 CTP synthase (glutamine hydrolyzing) [Candidatus Micrarchaeota archaeon]